MNECYCRTSTGNHSSCRVVKTDFLDRRVNDVLATRIIELVAGIVLSPFPCMNEIVPLISLIEILHDTTVVEETSCGVLYKPCGSNQISLAWPIIDVILGVICSVCVTLCFCKR